VDAPGSLLVDEAELLLTGQLERNSRASRVVSDERLEADPEEPRLLHIYVDADACPVKQEIFQVAKRCGLEVTLVANSWMRVPEETWIVLEVVDAGSDVADDWIVEHVQPHDIVITADIPLASRCLKVGARAMRPSGKPFTEDSIGLEVATRDLMADLRSAGEITGGPPPMKKRDRSYFLQQLDQAIQSIRRAHPPGSA